MTTPRKHHYIPQVHIKKFEGEKGYFVYHKNSKKVVPKRSTNDIFVVKDLNSSLDAEGDIDHSSVEKEFEQKWDSLFNTHFDIITSWLQDSIINDKYSKIEITESLKFFFEYSLIGMQRSQKQDKVFNDSILNPILDFEELIPELDEFDTSELDYPKDEIDLGLSSMKDFIQMATNQVKEWQNKLKFPAPVATDLSMLVPQGIVCEFIISKNKSFYLPDTTAIIIKSMDTFEYQNRTLNKIALVGLPLSWNIFLQIKNQDCFPSDVTDIYAWNDKRVDEHNKKIVSFAKKQVLVDDTFNH